MQKMKCKVCDKEFEFPYAERHTRKYCSHECAWIGIRGQRSSDTRIYTHCKTCNKRIWYHRSQNPKKFCCKECFVKGQETKFEIYCRWCGKPFDVTPTQYENGIRLCSWNCRVAEKDDAKNRICEICQKPFKVFRPSIQTRTCSKECSHILRKTGKYMTCEVCHKRKWVTPVFFDTFRFCSRKCRGIWQSERISGENHPNWSGGTSKFPYPFEWTDELKSQIKERDGNKCMECGAIENLSVHHINYDKSNCHPTNLICLCSPCNSRANFNRSHWQEKYENIIISIYNCSICKT